MELLFLLIFLIIFVAMVISDKLVYRVVFGVFVILCLIINGYLIGMQSFYGRGALVASVRKLAQISPMEQREELIKASNNFGRKYRKQSIYSLDASWQLLQDIKKAEESSLKEKQQVGDDVPD